VARIRCGGQGPPSFGRPGRQVPAPVGGQQVQRQIDAAGNAGGGGDPVVDDVKDVTHDPDELIPALQGVLDVVMRGGPPPVEQTRRGQRKRAAADAGYLTPSRNGTIQSSC